ncbi:putative DNA-binding protein [Sulfolobus polyhedral virus 1]|uniref:Putative DNA-binding protein n=1 Tax=Sulfolobus polyhedral virus 1 TaxID=1982658 RepID=A0A1W6I155_SPV1|nr:transcriptional regulator [Sulfolobus polyhedral virus 1]ARM37798.1 putative DNA-binding protein [Sulfolobus polyhedral virus 1]
MVGVLQFFNPESFVLTYIVKYEGLPVTEIFKKLNEEVKMDFSEFNEIIQLLIQQGFVSIRDDAKLFITDDGEKRDFALYLQVAVALYLRLMKNERL